ncbi:MAG: T9SS type A sorting domain-containing protein [Balneolaceae bacterium]|nr:T9SS type A sorting domain-containing protein [Balneolaceae bacterium]
MVTFTGLYHTVANSIDLTFSASGFSSLTSSAITVNPAAANNLDFTVQPANSNKNTDLTPSVEVQIYDTYGNAVSQSGTLVTLNLNSGSGNISGNTANTNAGGTAIFSTLSFNQTGDKTITASASGLTISPVSNTFTIANSGTLAGFLVEKTGNGTIGTQTAGTSFDIRLIAVDGVGDTLDGNMGRDEFTGSVDLTTTSIFSGSTTTTNIGPFVGGIYDPHSVELLQAGGSVTITATNSAGTESGSSNTFAVDPATASPDSSSTSVSASTLIADGSSTSTVTVQLTDIYGNNLTSGGDTVVISISSGTGSISGTTDNGDGTYTAVVTAPGSVGSATISATVNGSSITSGDPTITYTFGTLSTFLVEASGGGAIGTQTAGTSFNLQITAQDDYGNTVTTFNGSGNTVEITSSGTLTAGGGTSAQFTSGVLSSHSVTITSVSSTTITARKTASTETGTSNSFTVNPGAPSTTNSTITPGMSFLESNGTDNTPITVQLIDAYGNNLDSGGDTVVLSKTGAGSSLSAVSDNADGTYSATLTAGTITETVTITGTVNGSSITDDAEVTVTQFNYWEADAGGSAANKDDWDNTQNWSLASLPTTGQVVVIPSGITPSPIIENVNPTIDFLEIESGTNVTIVSRTITINEDISGAGSFSGNSATINLYGNSTINNFIAGSSTINLLGSSTQTIDNDFTADILNIQNDVTGTSYLEAFSTININLGQTLTMSSGSELVALGDINITGNLVGNTSTFKFGGDINGSNITLNSTSIFLDGSIEQQVNGIDNVNDLTVDNTAGVVFNNDLTVSGTLSILNGTLTIEAGYSLVSNTKSGSTSNIIMKRDISGSSGWRLLASPIDTDYGDLLDGTVTQGYTGAFYPTGSNPGDTVQANVLYYLESVSGTDNQRWRVPASAGTSLTPGRGIFVYFFGDVATDSRYNEALPDTLTVQGAENDGDGTSFSFPVSYTALADTGWNLAGNPFAATIDWDDGNWTKTNMDNTIYVWDPAGDQYLEWNGITGSLGDGTIKPFQGFWVKANGAGAPTLEVNKSSKTTGGSFYKSREDTVSLVLTVESEGFKRSTYLSFSPSGSYFKDPQDAFHLQPFNSDTYMEIFTLLDNGTQLAINNLPRNFGIPIEIPIYAQRYVYGKAIEKMMKLSWEGVENLPAGWKVSIIDRAKNKSRSAVTDLRTSKFIQFKNTTNSAKRTVEPNPSLSPISLKDEELASNTRYLLRIEPGDDANGLPKKFNLYQNYPNPFNPTTTISFDLPLQSQVQLTIFNILGQRVANLIDDELSAGTHTYEWDASRLSSGVYIYRLSTTDQVFVKKLTVIK